MSGLEDKKRDVRDLMDANELEIWDPPFRSRIPSPQHNAEIYVWTMRIGNPAKNEDIFADTLLGEYELWSEAENNIKEYLANA